MAGNGALEDAANIFVFMALLANGAGLIEAGFAVHLR